MKKGKMLIVESASSEKKDDDDFEEMEPSLSLESEELKPANLLRLSFSGTSLKNLVKVPMTHNQPQRAKTIMFRKLNEKSKKLEKKKQL